MVFWEITAIVAVIVSLVEFIALIYFYSWFSFQRSDSFFLKGRLFGIKLKQKFPSLFENRTNGDIFLSQFDSLMNNDPNDHFYCNLDDTEREFLTKIRKNYDHIVKKINKIKTAYQDLDQERVELKIGPLFEGQSGEYISVDENIRAYFKFSNGETVQYKEFNWKIKLFKINQSLVPPEKINDS